MRLPSTLLVDMQHVERISGGAPSVTWVRQDSTSISNGLWAENVMENFDAIQWERE